MTARQFCVAKHPLLSAGRGVPQCGHFSAFVDTLPPQSRHARTLTGGPRRREAQVVDISTAVICLHASLTSKNPRRPRQGMGLGVSHGVSKHKPVRAFKPRRITVFHAINDGDLAKYRTEPVLASTIPRTRLQAGRRAP